MTLATTAPKQPPLTDLLATSSDIQYQVIKRNGQLSAFDPARIVNVLTKAFMALEQKKQDHTENAVPDRIQTKVAELTQQVIDSLSRRMTFNGRVHIEDIQDQVELMLMRGGEHKVARDYVLYREAHAQQRADKPARISALQVTLENGQKQALDEVRLYDLVAEACIGLEDVAPEVVIKETLKNLFDGVPIADVNPTLVMCSRVLIEKEPNYSYVTTRLLLDSLRTEALTFVGYPTTQATSAEMANYYPHYFHRYIETGIKEELLSPVLAEFDLERLSNAIQAERDTQFTYLGLQTLYDRYFLHKGGLRFELPQAFFMRVAMGLSLNEIDREASTISFYNLLSSFDMMSSTPTLFNAGTLRSQLSSCYLTTIPDDLDGIFNGIRHNALLSKFAGGLGNDWTPVRAMGAHIKGTNGKSQGIVPFLKVANDTLVACNQGGKRKGSGCAYLETWHLDIEEFLDLRKNTGDDRRRTHDMNTANWIPDLFMKRVHESAPWTLFSPDEVPDLHEKYGQEFETAYVGYEEKSVRGEMRLSKKIEAVTLWRKMLTMLFETGHPWLTFKDVCNIRSPQQHVGVVHSSNLCCIASDQRVVTDRGMLTIGELYKQGGKNKVVGLDGVYDASEMLLPRPDAPMLQINTKEGYRHKVTPDHKVWVKNRGWVEAQNLKAGDDLLIQQLEGLWGKKHCPETAYLMGLIAGDGTFGKTNVHLDIWEHDYPHLEQITEQVHYLLAGNTVLKTTSTNTPQFYISQKNKRARLSSAPLRRLFETEGFNPKTKTSVPQMVWEGSKATVSEYLRGLYQADGHVQTGDSMTTLVLASKHLDFIQDLQILWANFGVKTSINKMRDEQLTLLPDGKGGKKDYVSKALYRLLITSIQGCQIAEEIIQFKKVKKSPAMDLFLVNLKKKGYQQKLYATFTQATALPNEDAYCLTVDSETHAWTVNGLITKNTEITLNTSEEEIAVCNLASVNLPRHIKDGELDMKKLEHTVTTAMRMLDNVIDVNYYAVNEARTANMRHRAIGLGVMGFQDALYKLRLSYQSKQAVTFADEAMEAISYFAIKASSDLAKERGSYHSFKGSLWHKGILPIDSLKLLAKERGEYLQVDYSSRLDWDSLREQVRGGMRNSNCMAIAPTATISNICGVSQSIEPAYRNLYVKSNLSGEFTIINPYLVQDLKERDLWDETMVNDLKYFDGSVQHIERIPDELKVMYMTAFELNPHWLIDAAARRQKWIDQAQSLNLYMLEPSGKRLDSLYKHAWLSGLKTTYYLRSQGATHVQKGDAKQSTEPQACAIDDPDCEACQ